MLGIGVFEPPPGGAKVLKYGNFWVWTIEYFNRRVKQQIETWPVGTYADFLRLIELMSASGRFAMPAKNTYKPVRLDAGKALAKARRRPGFEQAWDALEEEYATLAALLEARKSAGLTQEELAARMGTSKSAISRLEASLRDERHSPSFATLRKYAQACGRKLVVHLV